MAKSTTSLKILYGEGSEQVLVAQVPFLLDAGHVVETAIGRTAIENALDKTKFDLVVLGPSLTKNDRHHLPYVVKKGHAGTRVLVMHSDGERHHEVDLCLQTGRTMEDLVTRIAANWGQGGLSKSASAGT